MPWPPPTHIVIRPVGLSCQFSEFSIVSCSRAPVMPNGWPTAIAPPLTLSRRGRCRVLVRRHHLGGERLVDLDQVDVVDRHPGAGQGLLAGFDGSEPHDLRGPAHPDPGGDDARERRDAAF